VAQTMRTRQSMKAGIQLVACVVLAVAVIPHARGQTTNLSPGTIVGWGLDVLPYVPPVSQFTTIAAGGYHILALRTDGTVAAWGDDRWGQSTVPTNLTDVISVAAGYSHSLALTSNGTVVAWGDNSFGKCTVPENLDRVIAIAADGSHSLALLSNGTVVAWGSNYSGQTNVPADLCCVTAIAAGHNCSFALRSDGTVVAWGWNGYGQTNVPANLNDVIAIAAGDAHTLALKSDGTVVAWGAGLTNDPSDGVDYGQSIVPTNLSGVIAIAAGDYHSLALKSDGTVFAWGAGWTNNPFDSQSSLMHYGQSLVPTNLNSVTAIAAGWKFSLALVASSNESPVLQIQFLETNVSLFWPLSAGGFLLETTDKLAGTNSWTTVTNVQPIQNMQFTFSDLISGTNRFYRLRK
jgi:alpha-tubulin suppressor-like RCC1 family protein